MLNQPGLRELVESVFLRQLEILEPLQQIVAVCLVANRSNIRILVVSDLRPS